MTALLSLESVRKRYWRGHRPLDVLDGVSLDLAAGEFGAVWGPRSAGKTTLIELAAGLQAPDSGRVTFAGDDLARLSRKRVDRLLHTQIGIATRLGPASRELAVGDWVAMPLLDRAGTRDGARRAHLALERVGAEEIAGEPWPNLSDGERTLAAIARAIVREPTLLLVDDPSAGLGLLQRAEITGLLRSIAEEAGIAVLMTAAEMSEIQGAHAVWSLAGGRLTGRPAREGIVLGFPDRGAARLG